MNNEIVVVVQDNKRHRAGDVTRFAEKQVKISRSWCKMIHNVQVVDGLGFGVRMKACPVFTSTAHASMSALAWCLVSLVGSCKELYHLVDDKRICHSHDNFSGYLLTYIHNTMMKHCDVQNSRNSPFAGCNTDMLCESLQNGFGNLPVHCSSVLNIHSDILTRLFPSAAYPHIKVCSAQNDDIDASNDHVFIVVTDLPPSGCAHRVVEDEVSGSKVTYEARSVVGVTGNDVRGAYSGVRYCRHGGGYGRWWHQGKKCRVMVQLDHNCAADSFPSMEHHCVKFVTVYARITEVNVERYKLDMHISVGGQERIFCGCDGTRETTPLILTGENDRDKKPCSCPGCKRKEKYVCQKCGLRLCNQCYVGMTDLDNRKTITLTDLPVVGDNDDVVNTCDDDDADDGDLDGVNGGVEDHNENSDLVFARYDTDSDDDNGIDNITNEEMSKMDRIKRNAHRFAVEDDDGDFYGDCDRLVSGVLEHYLASRLCLTWRDAGDGIKLRYHRSLCGA